jgi:hypothetical protein
VRGRRRGEEGLPPRRGGVARAACQGGPPHHGRRCEGRADVGAAELAGFERRRCAHVGEERCGASEKSGATRRRGRARRGRSTRFGGKRLCSVGFYIEPWPFLLATVTKGPLGSGRFTNRD